MKRENLFRGKRTDNGEWVYGHYLTEVGRGIDGCENALIHFIKDKFGTQIVIPETIGQFTGLTDINGKEIFEGDIVRWVFEQHYWEAVISTVPNNKSNTLYAMETFHNCTTDDEGEFYTYKRSNSRNGSLNDIEYLSREREIIGNIHDNPELLK